MEDETGNEIVKEENQKIRIYDSKIDDVAKRAAEKMEIPVEKAKNELKIGVLNAVLLNRHRAQEIKDE